MIDEKHLNIDAIVLFEPSILIKWGVDSERTL